MDKEGFRQYLQERKLSEEMIVAQIQVAERFEASCQGERPTVDDLMAFVSVLIEEELNTFDNFLALARYARFIGNEPLYVATIELIDGAEALEGLYNSLGEVLGEEKRDEIFAGVELPPLGTPSADKPRLTQTVMERLERTVDAETCHQILSAGLRYLEDAWFANGREKYLQAGSVDAYLEQKGRDFVAELERIRDEDGLFFTQKITDEVIEFVRAHREISHGVREGNVIYEVKIPYMAKEYIAETDERMKRYYYCHCPWVRESLPQGEISVSPTFCLCSAGFHKKPWEVIFGQPLRAEIVETVLKGDPWCKIAIYLPEEAAAERDADTA